MGLLLTNVGVRRLAVSSAEDNQGDVSIVRFANTAAFTVDSTTRYTASSFNLNNGNNWFGRVVWAAGSSSC